METVFCKETNKEHYCLHESCDVISIISTSVSVTEVSTELLMKCSIIFLLYIFIYFLCFLGFFLLHLEFLYLFLMLFMSCEFRCFESYIKMLFKYYNHIHIILYFHTLYIHNSFCMYQAFHIWGDFFYSLCCCNI